MLGRRALYLWLRDAHLLCGLFASPLLLLFAVTTLRFNHAAPAAEEATPSAVEAPVRLSPESGGVQQARDVLRQVGVMGEIIYFVRDPDRLEIHAARPGEETTVRVDVARGMAAVERRHTGLDGRLAYLHRSPGPHVADIRGNWVYTRWWTSLVDGTVCLVLLISVTGIYLWAVVRAERRTGLMLIGLGTAAFFLLVSALVE